VVVEAEDTAELRPRATRAVSSEVMLTISPDPSWVSKVEVVMVVEVGAVMLGARGGRTRAHATCAALFVGTIALRYNSAPMNQTMPHDELRSFVDCDMSGRPGPSVSA